MQGTSYVRFGRFLVVGLALAMVSALFFATLASAQAPEARSATDQYEKPAAPEGPLAGKSCSKLEIGSDDGLFNAGDTVTYLGDFSVVPGASVTLDDADKTIGTFVDGENADISQGARVGVKIAATGDPVGVDGGNEALNDSVCNSLVGSQGLSGQEDGAAGNGNGGASGGDSSAEPGGSGPEGAVMGVLPDTGGIAISAYLGALLVAAGGLLFLRYRHANR